MLGVLAALAPVLHPESVSAASGVDDYPSRLKNAPQDSLVDPWLFYNRECTSWVAWRLNSENKVAFNDYWHGAHWGNASNWRNAAKSLGVPVDNNPTRGAVAWWAAGSAGSSRGHVAWVETVGDGAITVEEYNYLHAGKYDTRTISSSSSLWPSGFIHIKDTQIINTGVPVVSGKPQVGVRLTTTRGTWNAKNLTFSFQWLADGVPIPGATSRAFKPTADQLGKRIRAEVTASKAGAHSGTARSAPTDSVIKGVFVSSTQPVVSGTAQVGVQLSGTSGTIKPTTQLRYRWLAGWKPIADATGTTFTPTADQLDAVLRLRVIASAPGYRTLRVLSAPTNAVIPGEIVDRTPPSISGVAQVGQPLTAHPGTWAPAGQVAYQWLADGKPITGATVSSYTPTPNDLHKQISVKVTVSLKGYDDAVARSTPTTAVARGTLLNSVAPSVTGTPRVGVELTAHPGTFTPTATIAYQWKVDGTKVAGATRRTFTPRPQDLGKKVAVKVIASRPGYVTADVSSPPTAVVARGVIHNTALPKISGEAVDGERLTTTSGSWSITPTTLRYQWYAGNTAIAGATGSSYVVTAGKAGQRIHVVVTAKHAGYTAASASSAPTDRVVLGTVAFDQPTISGTAVVGRTLEAHVTGVVPKDATRHYRWYRDDQPIHAARDKTYVVRARDVGHRLHVVVTMTAHHWVTHARRSLAVGDVRSTPKLDPTTSMRRSRVLLDLTVTAPGLPSPSGHARVSVGKRFLGRVAVTNGHGSRLLRRMVRGTHTLKIVYRGYEQVSTVTRIPVNVT
ncbi:MAG: CHAP domain-containing protein [Nocardioides sp.]|nr:CHAP domain-containing protein [Nocardioides sp.]